MTTPQRTFGRPASLKHMMTAGKEFTDTAMALGIDEVLRTAKYQRRIGRAAADLSGVSLQREGDGDSKRIVFAAYDTLYDLMQPVVSVHGADEARELFKTETTRATLQDLSTELSSYALSDVAYRFKTQGSFLRITGDGLEIDDDCIMPKKFEAIRGGCPYARNANAAYFNRFTDHIVDTYAEAHRRNMPHGWLDATRQLLYRK